ncbi:MAG: PEP-CTERM sorting domain-containing protein [Tepidisphaeraceae bacterium]
MRLKSLAAVLSVVALAAPTFAAPVWNAFTIRTVSGANTPVVPVGTSDGSAFTVTIDESGEKAGYGTSYFDGQTVGSLTTVNYDRLDAGTKDPYLNLWVTDGTHSAVLAPVANMTASGNYTSNNVDHLNLQSLGFNIYETDFSDLSWLVPNATRVNQALIANNQVVTLADIASLTIEDPGTYSAFVGTGAPKNGTGFNLIFGDTQGNFSSPTPYSIANVTVPEPASLGLAALSGAALLRRRRKA